MAVVCPSVRLSVTLVIHASAIQHIETPFAPYDRAMLDALSLSLRRAELLVSVKFRCFLLQRSNQCHRHHPYIHQHSNTYRLTAASARHHGCETRLATAVFKKLLRYLIVNIVFSFARGRHIRRSTSVRLSVRLSNA